MMRNSIILMVFFFFMQQLYAQKLTGVWDGIMAGDETLHVAIQMKQKELCGYTADRVISSPSSHCKANFRGWYDANEQVWVLMGTTFIENSGDHILMVLRLWHQKGDPENVLRGTEEAKYGSSSIFNMGNSRGSLRLKRTSFKLPDDIPDCFPKIIKPSASHTQKEVTVMAAPKKQVPVTVTPEIPKKVLPVKPKPVIARKLIKEDKSVIPLEKTDTVKKIMPFISPHAPVIIDQPELVQKMKERKQKEFSHIIVNDKNITLNVYDNGIVDNDSVSIFYNGRLIAGKKRLSEKPIVIHLQLDEDVSVHEIVMYAENLGTIPPNTALIVLTAGNKRFELHSSASLTENAVLRFEYKPK